MSIRRDVPRRMFMASATPARPGALPSDRAMRDIVAKEMTKNGDGGTVTESSLDSRSTTRGVLSLNEEWLRKTVGSAQEGVFRLHLDYFFVAVLEALFQARALTLLLDETLPYEEQSIQDLRVALKGTQGEGARLMEWALRPREESDFCGEAPEALRHARVLFRKWSSPTAIHIMRTSRLRLLRFLCWLDFVGFPIEKRPAYSVGSEPPVSEATGLGDALLRSVDLWNSDSERTRAMCELRYFHKFKRIDPRTVGATPFVLFDMLDLMFTRDTFRDRLRPLGLEGHAWLRGRLRFFKEKACSDDPAVVATMMRRMRQFRHGMCFPEDVKEGAGAGETHHEKLARLGRIFLARISQTSAAARFCLGFRPAFLDHVLSAERAGMFMGLKDFFFDPSSPLGAETGHKDAPGAKKEHENAPVVVMFASACMMRSAWNLARATKRAFKTVEGASERGPAAERKLADALLGVLGEEPSGSLERAIDILQRRFAFDANAIPRRLFQNHLMSSPERGEVERWRSFANADTREELARQLVASHISTGADLPAATDSVPISLALPTEEDRGGGTSADTTSLAGLNFRGGLAKECAVMMRMCPLLLKSFIFKSNAGFITKGGELESGGRTVIDALIGGKNAPVTGGGASSTYGERSAQLWPVMLLQLKTGAKMLRFPFGVAIPSGEAPAGLPGL